MTNDKQQLPAVADHRNLTAYLNQIDAGLEFARMLLKSKTVPKRWETPEGLFAGVLHGNELGFTPLQSLQAVYVVHGMPAIDSHAIAALIRTNGGDIIKHEDTPEACELEITRPGATPVRYRYTMKEAVEAGLAASNPNYKKYPRQMLYAKCVTWGAKQLYQDILKGFRGKEELEDLPEVLAAEVKVTPAELLEQRKAQALPEPLPIETTATETEAGSIPEPIAKMVEAFKEFEITPAQIEQYCGNYLADLSHTQMKDLKSVYKDIKNGEPKETFFS